MEVYNVIRDLVEGGAAVLLISSELPELLALSNRIYVIHNGRVVRELSGEERSETNVLQGFFGRSLSISPRKETTNDH